MIHVILSRSEPAGSPAIEQPTALAFLMLCAVSAVGCQPAEETRRDWSLVQDSAAVRLLDVTSDLCRDCITFELAATVGDTAGEGFLEYTESFLQDRAGNYWFGQPQGGPKVFDPSGQYLLQIGRVGQGPFEFQMGIPVRSDIDGRVHIFDLGNVRETVVESDFTLHDERRLPVPARIAEPLPSRHAYALATAVPTPDGMGFPLHIMIGSEVIRSFGADTTPGSEPLDAFNQQRVIATDSRGHVLSARLYSYEIVAWTSEGRRVVGFRGPTLNAVEPLPTLVNFDNPPPNRIRDLRVDTAGRAWVLTHQRRPEWEDAVVEVVRPNGTVMVAPRDGDWNAVYESRLDVLDMATASFTSMQMDDRLFFAFLEDGSLVEYRPTDIGAPQYLIWKVNSTQ